MAKGNDGNYLQHSVEIAAAGLLAETDAAKQLHVAFTHGMAPFEPCDDDRHPPARALFRRTLNASYREYRPGEAGLVTAYRKTNASIQRYPNSAELVRTVIGEQNLSGGITELDAEKSRQLAEAWSGTGVVVTGASWRSQLDDGGALVRPVDSETPWLFTMDPMTYREHGDADDDQLYHADLERLSKALRRYVDSNAPGIAAVFVYSVKSDTWPQFWQFVDDLGDDLAANVASCWLTHRGGNRNLGALLCSRIELPPEFFPEGINPGRGD